jgi:uncharacterized protein YjbI with pentapeptide repeats
MNMEARRKGFVIIFLAASGLINRSEKIIDLSFVDLRGAKLRRNKGLLDGISLERADLLEADFTGVELTNVNFQGADLRYADLTETDLSGADFNDANLTEADLRGANLSEADLHGANLSGAKYNAKPLEDEGFILKPTQWPQGFDPKVHGANCVDC